MNIKLKFEPRDLWIGVYWDYDWTMDRKLVSGYRKLDVYVCVIPMLPLRFRFEWERILS